ALCRGFDHPRDWHDVAIVHFAEKEQRDVKVFGFDPLDAGPGAGQSLLQGDGVVADGVADIDSDERADACHDVPSNGTARPRCGRAAECFPEGNYSFFFLPALTVTSVILLSLMVRSAFLPTDLGLPQRFSICSIFPSFLSPFLSMMVTFVSSVTFPVSSLPFLSVTVSTLSLYETMVYVSAMTMPAIKAMQTRESSSLRIGVSSRGMGWWPTRVSRGRGAVSHWVGGARACYDEPGPCPQVPPGTRNSHMKFIPLTWRFRAAAVFACYLLAAGAVGLAGQPPEEEEAPKSKTTKKIVVEDPDPPSGTNKSPGGNAPDKRLDELDGAAAA